MNIKDLSYFCELVRQKSYTETAKLFSVSQPTITMAMKRLENELDDTPLIVQSHPRAKLTITRAGSVLYEQALQILQQLETTEREVKHAAEDKILLGISPVTGAQHFPKVAAQLSKAGIFKDLVITEAGSHQLLEDLLAGKIDIALLATIHPIEDEKLNAKLLSVNDFKIIVGDDNDLAQRSVVNFTDLKSEKFISMTNRYLHAHALQSYSSSAKFKPTIIYRTSDLSMVKALVTNNVGISLLVDSAINKNEAFTTLSLNDEIHEHSFMYLVTRKSFRPTEKQSFFMNLFEGIK